MRRFVILFPVCLLVGFALLQVPFVHAGVERFTVGLVDICAALIHAFGGKALVSGAVLQIP